MYFRTALLLCSCIFCFTASYTMECSAGEMDKFQADIKIEFGKPFDIQVGQSALLKSEEVRVTFDGIIMDNRCPVEEQCVWEGDAEVRIMISKINEKAKTLILHTSHRFATEGTHLGYKVKLLKLNPNKSENFPRNDYRATLTVAKLDFRQSQESSSR